MTSHPGHQAAQPDREDESVGGPAVHEWDRTKRAGVWPGPLFAASGMVARVLGSVRGTAGLASAGDDHQEDEDDTDRQHG